MKATRLAFGETLARLGETDEAIIALDADLSKSTMTKLFAEKFPDRFFDLGIAESNMIGVAAGLAMAGKKPFACSFACFVTGRYETIRMSAAYPKTAVRIVGTHAGLGIGEDGNSQMGLEDIGLMRNLPNMTVLQPADDIETQKAVEFMASHNEGPSYIRLTRQKLMDVNPSDYSFQWGKGVILADGNDVSIFASGATVESAVQAHDILAKKGIKARVINIHTIKPIDEDLILKCAMETGKIFTVEDHNIIGGLGSTICETLSENPVAVIRRWGLFDCFGESGSQKELYRKYKIDSEGVAEEVERFVRETDKPY